MLELAKNSQKENLHIDDTNQHVLVVASKKVTEFVSKTIGQGNCGGYEPTLILQVQPSK